MKPPKDDKKSYVIGTIFAFFAVLVVSPILIYDLINHFTLFTLSILTVLISSFLFILLITKCEIYKTGNSKACNIFMAIVLIIFSASGVVLLIGMIRNLFK